MKDFWKNNAARNKINHVSGFKNRKRSFAVQDFPLCTVTSIFCSYDA